MSNLINFSGVGQPEELPQTEYVRPGVDNFVIDKIEYNQPIREGGSSSLDIFFKKENSDASFKERFYLSEKALPRLQYLKTKVTGSPFEGELSIEQIKNSLVGISVRLTVDGKEVEVNGNLRTYCQLRFSGFAESINDKENWKLTNDMVRIEKLQGGNNSSPVNNESSNDDDLPF